MPRLGLGSIDLSAIGVGGAVTGIDDFFFESFSAGQMHPMLTTSRTNLIEHSEDIGSEGFSPVGTTVVADQTTSPDGAQTADLLKEDNSNGSHFMFKDFNLSSGKTYTISVFAKSNGANRHLKYGDGGVGWSSGFNAFFDLTNGTTSGSGTVAIDDVGNGWFRCSVTGTTSATTSRLIIYSTLSGTTGYQGDNSSGVFLYGLQIEQDGFVSAYIPTSGNTVTVPTTLNDTSDVWDFDGTDIMIAEDPEDEGFWEEGSNLVLNHNYEDLGSELIINGDFSTAGTITNSSYSLGWTSPDSGLSISSGVLNIVRTSSGGRAYASNGSSGNLTITNGKTYQLTYTITENSDNSTLQYHNGGVYVNTSNSAPGTYTVTYVSAGTIFLLRNAGSDGTTIKIDNVILKQVDPNDRWTLGTGWSIEDGKLKGDGTNTDFQSAQQNNVTTVGDTYEVTVTVEATSGAVELKGNGVYTRIDSLGVGTHTFYIVADATYIRFLAHASATITLDNFTVREYAVQPKDI